MRGVNTLELQEKLDELPEAEYSRRYDEAYNQAMAHCKENGWTPERVTQESPGETLGSWCHSMALTIMLSDMRDEEDKRTYPLCMECGETHDITKISCEEVAEYIEADREIGSPPY